MKKNSYHKGNVRADLIQAAEAILNEEGLAALSVRRVAREVGVVPSAVYNHFESLEDLLAAVAADGYQYMERLVDRLERGSGDPSQRLRRLAREYLQFAAANPNLYRLMFSSDVVAYRLHPELEQAADTSFGRLTQWWYGPGNYDSTRSAVKYPNALSVWSIMHGAALQMIEGLIQVDPRHKGAVDGLADAVIGTLIRGLMPALSEKA